MTAGPGPAAGPSWPDVDDLLAAIRATGKVLDDPSATLGDLCRAADAEWLTADAFRRHGVPLTEMEAGS